jgi:hypothetical protein
VLVSQARKQHPSTMNNARVWLSVAALLAPGLGVAAQPESSGPAIAQIAEQFDQHPLILVGELHRWEQLHAFIREMIRNPEFVCRADDIVVEFGNSRLQELADTYAFGGKVTDTQLQSLWRETAVPLTWNSPVYRQFYETVRDINQRHLCAHPIRIVLGDPPLDWSKIKTAKDYERWSDRDASFAEVVEREVLSKHHRAFLLAGQFHVVKQTPEGDKEGLRAAQLLERKHPGSLFSIVAVPSPAVAETMRMGPPPSFKIVRGSELETADFAMIATMNPHKKWPPMADVIDGLLYVGEQTLLYPSPAIYLDPAYQRELRRRASILKDFSGQDFMPVIDGLVKEARKAEKEPRRE